MNSGTRSGLRLLIAFMSLAFVVSVFFVSTPSTVVASPGWENILRGSDVTFNYDCWPPAFWYNYPAGSNPLAMAACTAGSGRVVATSTSWAVRNSYINLDMEQMMDVLFRWLAPGKSRSEIRILWYEGYNVYSAQKKASCTTLVTYLTGLGYDTNKIVADGTEPLSSILPGNYDIIFIPQLQPVGTASVEYYESIGGDPTLIPDSDYEAMRHFVEDLGKGLLVMEGCDFSTSGPYGHCHYRVQNEIINRIENGMYFQSDEIKKDSSSQGAFDVTFVVNESHWIGSTYKALHGSANCVLDSVGSMTPVPENNLGVAIDITPSFKYGAPGDTLTYEVTVTNTGTIVDDYNLTVSAGWSGVTISPDTLTNVAPKTSVTATVSVPISPSASRGSSTDITVTATSEENSSYTKSIKGSAHVARLPVEPVLGDWTSVYTAPRVLNYGNSVCGAGENIYILNSYSSSVQMSCSDFTTYSKGSYFMRYNTSTGYWEDLTFPSITFKNGSQLMSWDHGNYLYVLPGGAYSDARAQSVHGFYRYNIANGTWETLPDTPHWQGTGDSLVWVKLGANEYIYAWLGTTSYSVIYGGVEGDPEAELWRFNIATNSWDSNFLKHVEGYHDYPSNGATQAQAENGYGVDDGSGFVWTGGDYLYYTPGAYTEDLSNKDNERVFMRCTISTNTLTRMANAPTTSYGGVATNGGIDDGGSVVYPGSGDYIYVIKGGDDGAGGGGSTSGAFWRYRISTNTWEILDDLPVGVCANNGCRMGYAGGGKIYYWVGPSSGIASDKNLYVYGIEVPGVDVSVSPSENSAASGRTVTFNVTVRNTGTSSDTYDLTVSDNASWSPTLSKYSVGPLASGASENVTLSAAVPASAADGVSDSITVTATSQADNTATDSVSCIARCVNPPSIEVSISPSSKSGLSGSTLTYTVTVTNNGLTSDSYTLTKSENATPSWSSLSKTSGGPLASGASENVTLSVTIPAGTAEGASHRITVIATSQTKPTVKDNASCVARAVESIRPRVVVAISPSSKSGAPRDNITFTVTVTNAGNIDDGYNLSATDNLGWGLTLLPSSVTGMAPGEDRTVTLTVEIPDNAADGDSSGITVTATSIENTAVENSATCTARCVTGVTSVTSLTISPSRFALFPGYSGQVQSLTATLRAGNNPLPSKKITWSATAGSVSHSSSTTDALGQVSIYYTAPTVTVETSQVTITASFAGDAQYQASGENSLGIPAIPISVNIPASTGGTVIINVVEINVTVKILVVPANSLSTDTTITVVQAPRESVSNYSMVSRIFNIGPSGTTFTTPSTLTLPYDESELSAGVSEGDLAIYRHTSGGGWERVGGSVNTTANTVSVQIDHLSEYAVMASTVGGSGLPLLTIGVIVAVILIIIVIAIFIRRR